ncbi:MAG TPA: FAD:protein FMN transferase [Streptosporangiaceae bacterium]|jgi:thiamine biosynthesis lipoprotein|nr:FAD:protein FMN transferase [Streptosporangiaceae bacterium]
MTTVGVARDAFEVFGTMAVLLVTDPRAIGEARRIADRELALVDRACSRFREDSELMLLNAAAGVGPQTISPVFTDLLAAALRAARLTGGDVDPTCGRALTDLGYDRDFAQVRDAPPRLTGPVGPVPGWRRVHLDRAAHRVRLERGVQLDLGATAKAWASDRCAELIARRAGCGVLVSLGGDIAAAGPAPEDGWRVRVTDDHAAPASAPGQTVTVSSGGLATSSTTVRTWKVGGRQVHHIIDPATGEPARSCWRTVSVAAGSCTDANTASTAAIIRGPAAPDWLHDIGLPARLVRYDGSVETTAGWPRDDGPGTAA